MRHALDCGLCCGLAECDCMETDMETDMGEAKASDILAERDFLAEDGGLSNVGAYLSWIPGNTDAVLDGEFSADELEAIAWWMRHKGDAK